MIITLDPDPPPKKWGTRHEKILWFRISLKHLGAKKKNNKKSDNLLEFRRIFLFLNYKFQLSCLQIMKSCLSKCCFPSAYELPKSLLISCPESKKMRRGIAPHLPRIYKLVYWSKWKSSENCMLRDFPIFVLDVSVMWEESNTLKDMISWLTDTEVEIYNSETERFSWIQANYHFFY